MDVGTTVARAHLVEHRTRYPKVVDSVPIDDWCVCVFVHFNTFPFMSQLLQYQLKTTYNFPYAFPGLLVSLLHVDDVILTHAVAGSPSKFDHLSSV